ncbi:protein kinase [Streptomyces sp. NPDC006872]|uniref:protein kinase domain-containing protein n=1 Tax=Streptomyces sp. NPDC006872 TaxID=3155720 RepID=UPI0033DF8D00
MSDQLPPPPNSVVNPAANEAAALRQTGAAPLRIGDPGRVGPFVPVALLGSGGMGRVYLARAADDGPGLFAVKVIRPEYAEDVRFQRRFEREASVHGRLGPPHAPRLCGTGWDDRLLWMATEYIPGLDLAEAVREGGALPTATVWRLVAELGRALTALAAVGVVHRDLKPSNVLLSPQGAHVIDFGISKALDASAITGTGNRVGTAAYMSPEYLRTGHCDTASDVFSLAGTLLYAATGRAPFGDGTGVDVMHRVAFEQPNPEVTGAVSEVDPELGALLTACLAKEPERRPTPRQLIDTAGGRPATAGWPEPLHGHVLARRRAYETLYRLPVERAERLQPSDNRVKPVPVQEPARVQVPVPVPVQGSPAPGAPTPAPSAVAPTSLTAGRPPVRRKRILAAAAGTALCAVAAGAFVLVRTDGPAVASPEAVASADGGRSGDLPGGNARPSTTGAPGRTPATDASGRPADVTGDDESTPPDASAAATVPAVDGPRTTPAAPVDDTVASSTPAPTEPGAPAWITDCTYYSGNGRTDLGDSGKRVVQLQCMLTRRGYDVGGSGVDGDFGPDTETAVRGFQSDKGLAVDGIVGQNTWGALRAAD